MVKPNCFSKSTHEYKKFYPSYKLTETITNSQGKYYNKSYSFGEITKIWLV